MSQPVPLLVLGATCAQPWWVIAVVTRIAWNFPKAIRDEPWTVYPSGDDYRLAGPVLVGALERWEGKP